MDLIKTTLELNNIAGIFKNPIGITMALILILVFLFIINPSIKYLINIYRIKRLKSLDLDISSPILIIPENLGIIDNILLKKYKTKEQKSRILFNKMYDAALKEREKYDVEESQNKIVSPRFRTKKLKKN